MARDQTLWKTRLTERFPNQQRPPSQESERIALRACQRMAKNVARGARFVRPAKSAFALRPEAR